MSEEYKTKLNILSEQQQKFIPQITQGLRTKIHGGEFSIEEKLMCHSIYNTSEIVYNYLSKLIPLPNCENLKKFHKSIPFDTGLTSTMIDRLYTIAKTMKFSDKIVTLMLGSIDINPHLYYSGKLDKVLGFEDWGNCRRDIIADKCFVFAIRGIESNWFLPIAYSFADEIPKISRLTKLFKLVVKYLTSAGFHVVATVCDKEEWYEALLDKLRIETYEKRGPDTAENCE